MNKKPKFQFGIEFQEAILIFVLMDKYGYKAIDYIHEDYFAIPHHGLIFKAIKNFWKRNKRLPSKSVLKEKLRGMFESREFKSIIKDPDKKDIESLVDKTYNSLSKDGDIFLENIINFARYVTLKEHLETADLENFERYSEFSGKIQKAISLGNELDDSKGSFLVAGARDRIHQRALGIQVVPTGWWQLNRTLNGGGLEKHSVIMLMSEEKKFKTGMLINLGKAELGRRKNGFYIDLENGEIAITTRIDQSVIKSNKKSIVQGQHDDRLMKTYRKYKRIRAELIVKRFPAYRTNASHLQAWLDTIQLEYGIKFQYGIIDYPDLMAAISGRIEDEKRISDVYVDLKNLAKDNDLDYLITASHVKRDKETLKRTATKYHTSDVAKCIDKTRHVDLVLGLQQDESEVEAGVLRLEVVAQRDGTNGAILFWLDIENQWAKEFTKEQVQEYRAAMGKDEEGKSKKPVKNSDI